MLSIGTITVLCYQRYNMVTKDLHYPVSNPSSSLWTLFYIHTFAFAMALPPLLGWGKFNKNFLDTR